MDSSHSGIQSNSATSLPQALDDLYGLLRGSPYATAMIEAKKAFQARNFVETLRLVRMTGELHHRAHLSLIQLDPKKDGKTIDERQKIAARQTKLQVVLDLFAGVTRKLERLASIEPETPPISISPKRQEDPRLVPATPISEDFRDKFQAAGGDAAQFRLVEEWFYTQAVESEKYLQLGALFCLRHQGQIHLLRYAKRNAAMATATFEHALSGKPFKPLPLEKVLEFAANRQLHRLMPKNLPNSPEADELSNDHIVAIINKGSFTQLQTAAQATGLLPNADVIGFIRDNEFRNGRYQEAFDRIEGQFVHLRTAADQRMQRLRQEELRYKSGVLKMSPKEWLSKQQRDTAETQKITRTLRHFTKMLDGLRLMQSNPANISSDNSKAE